MTTGSARPAERPLRLVFVGRLVRAKGLFEIVAALAELKRAGRTFGLCIAGSGRLTSDPAIAQSSGSPRLDAGALALAKAGSGHYRPTTEDGRPVSSCFPLRIRFELRN